MTEPTDAEAWEMWLSQPLTGCASKSVGNFARAVLAKWGTPPAVAGEPVAYLHDDGYWTAAKTDVGRSLNDRLLFAGSPKVAVYTTPQPTQAQAGAVPLTDEQAKALLKNSDLLDMFLHIGWYSAPRKNFDAHGLTLIRAIEAAHGIGIKGGQHGADN